MYFLILLETRCECGIFLLGDRTNTVNTRMKKGKQDNCRCCDKELLQALRNIEFELRFLKCQQSMNCMDYALPLLLIGLLGGPFNSSASRWNKEEVEKFCREQKEKEKENI